MHLYSPEQVVKEVLANKILSESDTLFQRPNPYSGYFAGMIHCIMKLCVVWESTNTSWHIGTKHNWDMGMGHLWLNGWGIYGQGIYGLMGGAFTA